MTGAPLLAFGGWANVASAVVVRAKHILAGPIVRRVTTKQVAVWVAQSDQAPLAVATFDSEWIGDRPWSRRQPSSSPSELGPAGAARDLGTWTPSARLAADACTQHRVVLAAGDRAPEREPP